VRILACRLADAQPVARVGSSPIGCMASGRRSNRGVSWARQNWSPASATIMDVSS